MQPWQFNTRRWLKTLPLVACLLLTTACSVISLGYSVLPNYALWQIDRYVELDDSQREFVRAQLKEIQTWHRHNELPEYRKLLAEARRRSAKAVTAADLQWLRDEIDKRWLVTSERIAGPTAELLITLSSDQMKAMQRRFDQTNEDTRKKFLQTNLAERSQARQKRSIERFEKYLGDLTPEQEAVIRSSLAELPAEDDSWFKERLNRQRMFIDMTQRLRTEKPPKEVARALVKEYFVSAPKPKDPNAVRYYDRAIKVGDAMTVKVFSLRTDQQSKRFSEILDGWSAQIANIL